MPLETAEKQKLIKDHQVHATDTGSTEVQVAMLSKRITKLSEHLQGNIHDFASRQGLLKMIGKRKRLLSYIKEKNVQKYTSDCSSTSLSSSHKGTACASELR